MLNILSRRIATLRECPDWRLDCIWLLAIVWLSMFASKGALYQLSLYLLPGLVFLACPARIYTHARFATWVAIAFLLLLPTIVGDVHQLLAGRIPVHAFDSIWRLIVFPAAVILLLRGSRWGPQIILWAFVLICLLYLTIAVVYQVAGIDRWDGRLHGPVYNPNQFGVLMAAGVLCSLFLYWTVIDSSAWLRLLPVCGAVLLFVGCLLSGSRSSLLGLGVACLTGLCIGSLQMQRSRLQTLLVRVFLPAGICGVVLTALYLVRLQSESNQPLDIESFLIRLEIWQHYLGFWRQNFWVGTLLDSSTRPVIDGVGYGPHNLYLEIAVMSGLLGITAFFLGLCLLMRELAILLSIEMIFPLALLELLLMFCLFNSSIYSSEVLQGIFCLVFVEAALLARK